MSATQTATVERPAADSGRPLQLNSRLTSLSFLNYPNRPDFLSSPISPPQQTNHKIPASEFSQTVIALIGVQYKTRPSPNPTTQILLNQFLGGARATTHPTSVEWSCYTDHNDYYNLCARAEWPSSAHYSLWAETSGFKWWWDRLDPSEATHGWFLELFFPTVKRMSGKITSDEREDPGIMRDRIPTGAGGDRLAGKKDVKSPGLPGGGPLCDRVRVRGKKNLVVVRSVQNYTMHRDREASERKDARAIVKDAATAVRIMVPGCYSSRYMESVDLVTGESTADRTSLLVYCAEFKWLGAWFKRYVAHSAAFEGLRTWFQQRLKKRLDVDEFYEVMVLKKEEQMFEYIACHGETGMLVTHREERRACLVI